MAQASAPRRPPSAEIEAAGANPPKQYAGRYLGCFADKKQRDLTGPQSRQTSPQACVQYCAELEHSYAAMQRGKACFCGDSHGRYGPSTACKPCAGQPGESCGGPWANAVWEVGGQRAPPRLPPNLLPPARRASMPVSAASAAASSVLR